MSTRRENPHFKDGVDYTWQTTEEFNNLVKMFRDRTVKLTEMTEAKKMHETILNQLRLKLKNKPIRCSRLEYTGSAYEKALISKQFDFDIMVIIEGGRDLKKDCSETPPGYVLLRHSDDSEGSAFVSADKVASRFMAQLSFCIKEIQDEHSERDDAPEELKNITENIVLRKHGPAIQMDVYRRNDSGEKEKFYSVDMVPTFEISTPEGEPEYYVAKRLKVIDDKNFPKLKFAWRQSFSLKEKDLLSGTDKNNTCRKDVFRILKAIRNKECGLATLTSYHLKTVILKELKDRSGDEDWNEKLLGKRLMDCIGRLVDEVGKETMVTETPGRGRKRETKDVKPKRVARKGRMPHYFIPEIDLLECIKEKACVNVYYRLKRLKNSQQQMEAILDVTGRPGARRKAKKRGIASTTGKSAKPKQRKPKRNLGKADSFPWDSVMEMLANLRNSHANTHDDDSQSELPRNVDEFDTDEDDPVIHFECTQS